MQLLNCFPGQGLKCARRLARSGISLTPFPDTRVVTTPASLLLRSALTRLGDLVIARPASYNYLDFLYTRNHKLSSYTTAIPAKHVKKSFEITFTHDSRPVYTISHKRSLIGQLLWIRKPLMYTILGVSMYGQAASDHAVLVSWVYIFGGELSKSQHIARVKRKENISALNYEIELICRVKQSICIRILARPRKNIYG